MAEDEFSRQLQAHLIEISRIYWTLYLERCGNAQKRRSLQRAEDVLVKLQARKGIDAILSQLQRAAAEVATRRSDLIRSEMAVKNSEARIRALVNSPLLGTDESTELLPMDKPSEIPVIFSMEESKARGELVTRSQVNSIMELPDTLSVCNMKFHLETALHEPERNVAPLSFVSFRINMKRQSAR